MINYKMKPKILILGKLPPPYMGPAIATQIILNSSLKEKYHLIHISTQVNKSFDTQGKISLSKIYKNITLYVNLWKMAKEHHPELMLFPFSQETVGFLKDIPYIIIAKHFKIKIILQLRGSNFKTWLSNSSKLTNLVVKKTLSKTSAIIVLGEKLRYLFEDFFPKGRIFVVPNGGDFVIKKHTDIDGQIRLMYTGNYLPSKGFDVILKAISILPRKYRDMIHLTAIGGWQGTEFQDSCQKIIKDNKLNVTLYEQTESNKKFTHLSHSDIFIFVPVKPEGHPWVIVEAMAAGLPIIATDQGAITESVINNENGYIIPSNNINALADKLLFLIQHQDIREKMGEQSLCFYQQKFNENALVKNFTTTFDSILSI